MFAVEDTKTEKNQQKIGSIGALVHIYKHCFFFLGTVQKNKVLLTQLFLFLLQLSVEYEKNSHMSLLYSIELILTQVHEIGNMNLKPKEKNFKKFF